MKIIQCSPSMESDRMYCPSTDEVIFAPDYEEINEKDGTNNSCQLPTAFFSLSPNIVAIFNTSFS